MPCRHGYAEGLCIRVLAIGGNHSMGASGVSAPGTTKQDRATTIIVDRFPRQETAGVPGRTGRCRSQERSLRGISVTGHRPKGRAGFLSGLPRWTGSAPAARRGRTDHRQDTFGITSVKSHNYGKAADVTLPAGAGPATQRPTGFRQEADGRIHVSVRQSSCPGASRRECPTGCGKGEVGLGAGRKTVCQFRHIGPGCAGAQLPPPGC